MANIVQILAGVCYKVGYKAVGHCHQASISVTVAAIALIVGILPLLFITELLNLDNKIIILVLISLFSIFYFTKKVGKFVCLIIMAFLWGNWNGTNIRDNVYFLSKTNNRIDVTVISIPVVGRDQKLKVRIDKINNNLIFPPLYATWKTSESVCAGQSWRITGKLRALHSSLNEGSFNQQRYLLANRIIGTLKSNDTQILSPDCSIRQKTIDYFYKLIMPLANSGVIYGLMFGERTLLSSRQSQLLQSTGLTHLMAISGLHIGLAYFFGFMIARGGQYFLPLKYINEKVPIILGLVLALFYAWVSGLAIPATRALFSLLLWVYIRNKPVYYFSWQWALWSIAGILLLDPLAILSDSFWLSAFAVLAIIYWLTVFPLPPQLIERAVVGKIIALTHLQVGLLILLIPAQLIIFNGINFMSLIANLWFVPLISWIVVPAILTLFLIPIGEVQKVILYSIDKVIEIGFKPLNYLSRFWLEFNNVPYYLFFLCWLSVLVVVFKWYKSYFGLVSCIIILILVESKNSQKPKGDWSLTVLDIGHGLAVVIEQNNLALLYDTGNYWKGNSNAQRQIIPFLKYWGITPISIILSHNHLDHTGGTTELLRMYPWLSIRSSFGSLSKIINNQGIIDKQKITHHLPCIKGQKWQWGVLTFETLWPEKLSEISHNNDSCVIQFTDGYHKILLTGDLEKQGEKSIVEMYKHKLQSTILFAPHHGSNTSSTKLLLRTVNPSIALVSSARYSAWKIPAKKIYFRYKNSNIRWLNTAEEGQLTLWFKKENINILRFRHEIQPRWYHLWFGLPLFPE
ncbi:DNA internalization-related competence protein ComEC/Rec2 [Providencia sp. Me31A]|uniref:DNA internalization-related competence protein ComEC/Rec2 n=1 Tax=Providencia sp. Me31A TaxID=3392637 RepID=UPI003D2B42FD